MSLCPGLRRFCLALSLIALQLGWSLWAAPVSFSADSVTSSLAKGRERTLLSGNAKVQTGSVSITADSIELSGKDFTFLQCKGSVVVIDSERKIRLEAPSLYYDRGTKLTRTLGPSSLEDQKNKLVLKAEWIENDGSTEVTLAEVGVRIIKDKLVCRSEYALYRRKDSELELTGDPMAKKNGDEYRATRILVNTDTEDIQLEGTVSGKVTEKASSSDSGAKGKPGDGTAPGAPGPVGASGNGGPGGSGASASGGGAAGSASGQGSAP